MKRFLGLVCLVTLVMVMAGVPVCAENVDDSTTTEKEVETSKDVDEEDVDKQDAIDEEGILEKEEKEEKEEVKRINVYINGQSIDFEVPPVLIHSRTYVEARGIMEALGYAMEWDEKNRIVTAKKNHLTIYIPIDNKEVRLIDGEYDHELMWEEPACIVDDRTMIPLRFMGELTLMDVQWIDKEEEHSVTLEPFKHNTGDLVVGIKNITGNTLTLDGYYDICGIDSLVGGYAYRLNTLEGDRLVLPISPKVQYQLLGVDPDDPVRVVSRQQFDKETTAKETLFSLLEFSTFTVTIENGQVVCITQNDRP